MPFVHVRCSDAQRADFDERAKAANMSPSEYGREVLFRPRTESEEPKPKLTDTECLYGLPDHWQVTLNAEGTDKQFTGVNFVCPHRARQPDMKPEKVLAFCKLCPRWLTMKAKKAGKKPGTSTAAGTRTYAGSTSQSSAGWSEPRWQGEYGRPWR